MTVETTSEQVMAESIIISWSNNQAFLLTVSPPLLLVQVFLVYGRTGWIGGLLGDLLKTQGATWEYGTARLEDRAAILADINRVSSRSKIV